MIISKPAIVFHTSQIFFNFLAMACFASVASFQAKWGVGPCKNVTLLSRRAPSHQVLLSSWSIRIRALHLYCRDASLLVLALRSRVE